MRKYSKEINRFLPLKSGWKGSINQDTKVVFFFLSWNKQGWSTYIMNFVWNILNLKASQLTVDNWKCGQETRNRDLGCGCRQKNC